MFAAKIMIFKNQMLGCWMDWRGSFTPCTLSGKEASSDGTAFFPCGVSPKNTLRVATVFSSVARVLCDCRFVEQGEWIL